MRADTLAEFSQGVSEPARGDRAVGRGSKAQSRTVGAEVKRSLVGLRQKTAVFLLVESRFVRRRWDRAGLWRVGLGLLVVRSDYVAVRGHLSAADLRLLSLPESVLERFEGYCLGSFQDSQFRRVITRARDLRMTQPFGKFLERVPVRYCAIEVSEFVLNDRLDLFAGWQLIVDYIVKPPEQSAIEQPLVVRRRDDETIGAILL
jgi:hypothetical protein